MKKPEKRVEKRSSPSLESLLVQLIANQQILTQQLAKLNSRLFVLEGVLGNTEIEEDEADEKLYNDAVEVVREAKKASTSLLQRRLRIGYGRAARIMDLLEENGIIGPADGATPRDVL